MSKNKEDPLIEKFLASKLYKRLWSKGWQLVHESIIREFVKRTRKTAYIPRDAEGFISINENNLE